MVIVLEILLVPFAAWAIWSLFSRFLRLRAPAEPADDPFALVSAPLRRNPKGRSSAVAVEEPEGDDGDVSFPPRTM
jgi:hypothetical protein